MFRKIQKSKTFRRISGIFGFLGFGIFGFSEKTKNPKLLGKSLEVLDFWIFFFCGFFKKNPLFFWIFMKNPKTTLGNTMVLYYQMRKIQIFPLFFWIFHKNPRKNNENPKLQKTKTSRDFPKSFGFLDIWVFWIVMKIVYLFPS